MNTLAAKILANQIRASRYKRAEKILREVRKRVFDYEDMGKLEKAQKVISVCKRILAPKWQAERAAAEDRRLQQTPSAFEPGCR